METVEIDFWRALEFRICSEFTGFDDRHLRHYWCDGLVPDEYDLEADQPCIRGLAYCRQSGQERWRFTLLIGAAVGSVEDIDWQSLIPVEQATGWMSPRPEDQTLILDPLGASDV